MTTTQREYPREADTFGETPWADVVAITVARDLPTGVSGDWQDVIALPDGKIALVVGDAAGHGVAAAPVRRVVQPRLRRLARTGLEPAEIFGSLRKAVASQGDAYVTAVYVVVGPKDGEIIVASAGHPISYSATPTSRPRGQHGNMHPDRPQP